MSRFHIVDGGAVITKHAGVFKQVDLYRRGRDLYAAHKGGYVLLNAARGEIGDTSVPDLTWHHIDAAGQQVSRGEFNRPVLEVEP